ncbi:MAG: M56 family metallopeptidase [Actinobacteria bacterium]|nr:M56 family metallopeptidase [Actinomycetota bacterium]
MNAAGIALVGALALAAPALGGVVSDRRASPRVAAALHLWALIGIAVAPIAFLLCLAGPGSLLRGTSHGAHEHDRQILAWVALGVVGAILGWLAVATVRTLRATLAVGPRRLSVGEPTATPEGVPVYILPVERPVAFAVGLRRARVVVSQGLMDLLSEEERRAAVAHEVAHVQGGHPGLLLVGHVMTQAFGVLPPARRAFASLRRELEAAADDHAARAVGDPEVVARAIAKVGLTSAAPAPSAALADEADLGYRVGRLLGRYPESRTRATVALALTGLLAIGVVAALCGALHPGALWTGVVACSALLGWIGLRPFRSVRA